MKPLHFDDLDDDDDEFDMSGDWGIRDQQRHKVSEYTAIIIIRVDYLHYSLYQIQNSPITCTMITY